MGHHHHHHQHHQQPPTPDSNEFQQLRFEDLRKHDALQQSIYGPEHAACHVPPQAHSEYCSPSLVQSSFTPLSMRPYDEQSYHFSHNPQYETAENVGLGVQLPYGDGSFMQPQCYAFDQGEYYEAPRSPPKMGRGKGPLTPKSPASDMGKRNKSAKLSETPVSPKTKNKPRPVRAARGKGSASNKSVTTTKIKLDKPLSELTAHMTDVPLRDIEAWVNRSSEERHKEVEKKNGSIPRPMNSFMLYRSAYAERTKRWCTQNNHQVVSSVSGESWPLEPQDVRTKFNDYAAIERLNHARAHPNYKFSPSKVQSVAKRRKDEASDDEDEGSWHNGGDGDAEWRPNGERRSKARSSRRRVHAASESSFSSPQNYFEDRPWGQQFPDTPVPVTAAWPPPQHGQGRVLSISMGSADPRQPYMAQQPYVQQPAMPSPVSDSLRGVPRGSHGDIYEQQMPAGIPGSYQAEIFSQAQTPLSYQEQFEPAGHYYEHPAPPPPDFFSPDGIFNDRAPPSSIFSPGGAYEYGPVTHHHQQQQQQHQQPFEWTDY